MSVVNALSGIGGNVAPGELVRVSGAGFGGETVAEVWFGARSVPVLQSEPGQLTVQVPEEVAGASSTRVEVRVAGKLVGGTDLGVAEAAPGLLPLAVNQDGWPNNAMRPAGAGDLLILFATGQGRLEEARPVLPVAVTVAGVEAEVARAEAASGATGLLLLMVRVPGGFVPSGQVPLVLTVGSAKAEPVGVWLR